MLAGPKARTVLGHDPRRAPARSRFSGLDHPTPWTPLRPVDAAASRRMRCWTRAIAGARAHRVWIGVCLAIAAVFAILRLAGLPIRMVASGSGLVIFMTILLSSVVAGRLGGGFSIVRATVAAVAVSAGWWWMFRRQTWASRLTDRVKDPARRDAALASLEERVTELLADPSTEARAELRRAATPFLVADRPDRAVAVLLAAGEGDLAPDARLHHLGNLAFAQLQLGDPAAAEATLVRADGAPDDPLAALFVSSTKALVLAVRGRHEEALTLLASLKIPSPHALDLTAIVTRAHASAGAGDEGEARALLERLLAAGARETVERATKHGGPASPVARALLEEQGSPYRS